MATNQVGNKPSAAIINKELKAKLVEKPDSSAVAAMKELGVKNRADGSISGAEMADAIVKGTKDFDNASAGSEFKAIEKFVTLNESKLSPEAKKVFDIYKKHAEKAQKGGHTGIDFRDYQAMQREMRSASTVKPQDAGAGKSLKDLAANNKTPGSISGKEMADAIVKGTKDFDNQSAGKEFNDIAKFVKENSQLLSPEAKKAFAVYEKAAQAAREKGETGIPNKEYGRMVRDMMRAAQPQTSQAPVTSAPPAAPPPLS